MSSPRCFRSLAALIVALWATAATAQSFGTSVQFSDYGGTTYSTITSTSSLTVTAGQAIVVATRFLRSGTPTVTVSGGGNTYTSRGSNLAGDGTWLEVFVAENAAGGTYAISVTYSAAQQYAGLLAGTYSTVATSSAFDVGNNGYAGLPSVSSGSFTTTQAQEILIAFSQVSGTGLTWTAGTGYTIRAQDASKVLMLQDKSVNAIQTGATASASANGGGIPKSIVVVTLKAPPVGRTRMTLLGFGN